MNTPILPWFAYKIHDNNLFIRTPNRPEVAIDYTGYVNALSFSLDTTGTKLAANITKSDHPEDYISQNIFRFDGHNLSVFDLKTKHVAQILPDSYFAKSSLSSIAWVPGQDRLLFSKIWTGMYTVRSDGSDVQLILRGTNIDHFSPSPTGAYIGFIKYKGGTGDHIGVFDIKTNTARIFSTTVTRWDWLDENRIVFYKNEKKIQALDVQTGRVSTLFTNTTLSTIFGMPLGDKITDLHIGIRSPGQRIDVVGERIYFTFVAAHEKVNHTPTFVSYFVSIGTDGDSPSIHVALPQKNTRSQMLLFKNTVTEFIDRIIHEGKRCFTVCIGQVDKKGKLVGFRFESIGTRPEDLDLTWCIVPASYHNPPYLTYLSRGEQEQYETELQERIRVQK